MAFYFLLNIRFLIFIQVLLVAVICSLLWPYCISLTLCVYHKLCILFFLTSWLFLVDIMMLKYRSEIVSKCFLEHMLCSYFVTVKCHGSHMDLCCQNGTS
jgi:hypothetical protein